MNFIEVISWETFKMLFSKIKMKLVKARSTAGLFLTLKTIILSNFSYLYTYF